MSKKEMNKAIKGMDNSGDREKFIENVKNGKIKEKEKGHTNSLAPQKKERGDAISQLEKSGDIAKQGFFAERTPGAEGKILAKIKENRGQQSFGNAKAPDPKRIAKINAFANYLEVKEGKNSKEDQLDAKRELLNASSIKGENVDKTSFAGGSEKPESSSTSSEPPTPPSQPSREPASAPPIPPAPTSSPSTQ